MVLRFKYAVMSRMEKIINVLWVGLLLGVFAIGCIPEPLDVKGIPAVPQQIVVTSQIIPDRSLVVLLTRTFGALEASEDSDPQEVLDEVAVADAVVTLSGPDGTDTLLSLDNGFYGGLTTPFQAGESYTLHVVSTSLGEVSATTIVKPTISFSNISASLYYNGYGDTLAQIVYSFQDPAQANWYMLNAQPLEQNDLVGQILNPEAYTRLLEDTGFNGQQYGEIVRVFPRDYQPGDSLAVSLSHISEDYYKFMELRLDNRFSFIEYLSEPVNYPSNVVGGKGFFNLYLPDVRVFVLQ